MLAFRVGDSAVQLATGPLELKRYAVGFGVGNPGMIEGFSRDPLLIMSDRGQIRFFPRTSMHKLVDTPYLASMARYWKGVAPAYDVVVGLADTPDEAVANLNLAAGYRKGAKPTVEWAKPTVDWAKPWARSTVDAVVDVAGTSDEARALKLEETARASEVLAAETELAAAETVRKTLDLEIDKKRKRVDDARAKLATAHAKTHCACSECTAQFALFQGRRLTARSSCGHGEARTQLPALDDACKTLKGHHPACACFE
jgi:hypothetical protein